jgi:hypothetical protein
MMYTLAITDSMSVTQALRRGPLGSHGDRANSGSAAKSTLAQGALRLTPQASLAEAAARHAGFQRPPVWGRVRCGY